MQQPVTVLLPAFNAQAYLDAALLSLSSQTYLAFEALVLDDGSTDATPDIAAKWGKHDSRFRLVRAETNAGLIATLNRGLDMAGTDWVARMDADDICASSRLAKQMAWVKAHPRTVSLGTQGTMFQDANGPIRFPCSSDAIQRRLPFDTPMLHPSVLMNLSWLNQQGALRYDPSATHAEDYALWANIAARGGKLANLPEHLLQYRVHGNSVSQAKREAQEHTAIRIRQGVLATHGMDLTEDEIRLMSSHMFKPQRSLTRFSLAQFRALDRRLAQLPLLGNPHGADSLYERGRFLVSMLPRPNSARDKLQLAWSLTKINPLLGSTFIPLFLAGRP